MSSLPASRNGPAVNGAPRGGSSKAERLVVAQLTRVRVPSLTPKDARGRLAVRCTAWADRTGKRQAPPPAANFPSSAPGARDTGGPAPGLRPIGLSGGSAGRGLQRLDVAQPGRAPDWGSGDRGFESRLPDQTSGCRVEGAHGVWGSEASVRIRPPRPDYARLRCHSGSRLSRPRLREAEARARFVTALLAEAKSR